MTRTTGLGVSVVVALAAWVGISDPRRSWEIRAGRPVAGARDDLGPGALSSGDETTIAPIEPASPERLADTQLLDWPDGDVLSRAGLDIDTGMFGNAGGDDWRFTLAGLEDVQAAFAMWSLDPLLDLDLSLPEDVETVRTPTSAPLPAASSDAPILVAARDAPAIVTSSHTVPRPTSAIEATPAPHVATALPAADPPRAPGHTHEPTALTARRDVSAGAVVVRAAVVGDGQRLASDGPPGPLAALDEASHFDAHARRVPQAHASERVARDDGCGDTGCDVHRLVRVRQRLLDRAPAGAFTDDPARTRVRARLGRALQSIERALARADAPRARPGHARSVGRRIDAYEARVRSRTVERGLVDPTLTRDLHFPVTGLARWR